jgi:protein-disulfide isomerase
MQWRRLIAAWLLALAAGLAQAPGPAKSALDKPTLEAYVRHLLLWNPQIQVRVSDAKPAPMPGFQEFTVTGSYGQASVDEIFYVSNDGSRIVRGTVYEVGASPFKKELSLLKTEGHPSMGTPKAPVVIVLFSDFQCSYCRNEAKQLRGSLLKEFPSQVQLIFKDMPIDAIHPWARAAAIAGRCAYRQGPEKFWAYHDWIFDKQGEITAENVQAKVMEWAGASGLDAVRFGRCVSERQTEAEINASVAEARSLRVDSTPTLFINGRKIPGSVPFAQLKAIIEFELDYTKARAQEAQECCALPLPAPPRK